MWTNTGWKPRPVDSKPELFCKPLALEALAAVPGVEIPTTPQGQDTGDQCRCDWMQGAGEGFLEVVTKTNR